MHCHMTIHIALEGAKLVNADANLMHKKTAFGQKVASAKQPKPANQNQTPIPLAAPQLPKSSQIKCPSRGRLLLQEK